MHEAEGAFHIQILSTCRKKGSSAAMTLSPKPSHWPSMSVSVWFRRFYLSSHQLSPSTPTAYSAQLPPKRPAHLRLPFSLNYDRHVVRELRKEADSQWGGLKLLNTTLYTAMRNTAQLKRNQGACTGRKAKREVSFPSWTVTSTRI